jgi:zinc transporter ZupT
MSDKWKWFFIFLVGGILAIIMGYVIAYVIFLMDSSSIWIDRIEAVGWGFGGAFIIVAILIAIFVKSKQSDE